MSKDENPAIRSLKILEDFFSSSDSGKLFEPFPDRAFSGLRKELRTVLVDLLFPLRPELEGLRGISWVYKEFARRLSVFEERAGIDLSGSHINGPGLHKHIPDAVSSLEGRDSLDREVVLFLAMLPFPGQWKWLELATVCFSTDPEIQDFLEAERCTIQRKLAKKNMKKLNLGSFCQILKAPCLPREKGVLRIFSRPYLFCSCPETLREISTRYILYVEPAAGINFRHSWMRVYSTLADPVLFGVGSEEDGRFLSSQPGILTTRLAHGDYLKETPEPGPESTSGKPGEGADGFDGKEKYDIVFNNTFDEMDRKRHLFMLDLMMHPMLEDITVLFIGRGSHANLKIFREEICKRGLQERCRVVANIMRREVPACLAACRMGVHLSLQENGCRAVYEYFRANIPCVMSSITAGMNMDIINRGTGVSATDEEMPRTIHSVLRERKRFEPRAWFLEHSGSIHSSAELNGVLKTLSKKCGYEWHKDIVPMTSSGLGRYADKQDRDGFKPLFDELHALLSRGCFRSGSHG